MARPFLLLTILNDAGSLHAIPPGADAEISGHAPLVAELVGHAIGVFTNLAADDPERRRVSGRSYRGCSNRAGPLVAMCGSTIAGGPPTTRAITNMRQSWSLSVRMPSYALLAQP